MLRKALASDSVVADRTARSTPFHGSTQPNAEATTVRKNVTEQRTPSPADSCQFSPPKRVWFADDTEPKGVRLHGVCTAYDDPSDETGRSRPDRLPSNARQRQERRKEKASSDVVERSGPETLLSAKQRQKRMKKKTSRDKTDPLASLICSHWDYMARLYDESEARLTYVENGGLTHAASRRVTHHSPSQAGNGRDFGCGSQSPRGPPTRH